MAAGHGQKYVVKELIKAGTTDVDKSSTEDGSTPYIVAGRWPWSQDSQGGYGGADQGRRKVWTRLR